MNKVMREVLEWAGVLLVLFIGIFGEGIYDALFMHG